jgi:hypothetical protein
MKHPIHTALRAGVHLLMRTPHFVRNPLIPTEARAIVKQRLDGRQATFLSVLRDAIYASPGGPVLRLLDHAGVEFGDVKSMVEHEGVEGTLNRLSDSGVYFSVSEYKGYTPVRRGSLEFACTPDDFRNPLARFHVEGSSGGSRSKGTPVLIDLDFIRACGASNALSLAARGGADWVKFVWEVPGAGARFRLLKQTSFGSPPVAWFSQLDIDQANLHPMFRWSEMALRRAARLGGVALPQPVHSPLDRPIEVARFMREQIDRGRTPHSLTFASSGVRLSEAALSEGISLEGGQLTLGGEPVTAARLERVRECGLSAWPRYGAMETGPIGYPCLEPTAADDVHVQSDLHALIQPGDSAGGARPDALFVTSLHPRSPFRFLNVSMGDSAVYERRSCGCAMESEGFAWHLRDVKSFEKLTAAGMTFLDVDVIRILESVLPDAFGGGPTDYQLAEMLSEESGESRLILRAHPRIGDIDESVLKARFLQEIGRGSIVDAAMSAVWEESSLLEIERVAPATTRSAKILHLRSRGSSSAG